MNIPTDAMIGDTYVFVLEQPDVLYELRSISTSGTLKFQADNRQRKSLSTANFERMRGDGCAKRVHRSGITDRGLLPRSLDPRLFIEQTKHTVSSAERKQIEKNAKKLDEARTLSFYVKRLTESVGVSKYTPVLRAFIEDNYPDAQANGHHWKPSTSSLMRVIDKHGGEPGSITLAAIHDKRGLHSLNARWDEPIVKMRQKAVAFYWSSRTPSLSMPEALAYFFAALIRLNRRRERVGATAFKLPSDQTVTDWINGAVSQWTALDDWSGCVVS